MWVWFVKAASVNCVDFSRSAESLALIDDIKGLLGSLLPKGATPRTCLSCELMCWVLFWMLRTLFANLFKATLFDSRHLSDIQHWIGYDLLQNCGFACFPSLLCRVHAGFCISLRGKTVYWVQNKPNPEVNRLNKNVSKTGAAKGHCMINERFLVDLQRSFCVHVGEEPQSKPSLPCSPFGRPLP